MSGLMRFSSKASFVFLLFVCAGTAAGRTKWVEVQSPHFRVITNGTQSDGRGVALKLEQLRYVFASHFPNLRLDSGAPLIVFAARDEATARSLLPALKKAKDGQYIAGIYFHGWEKQYAMLRLDETDIDTVYHEYVHSILHTNAQWLPTWLDEGIAEFYTYTRFEKHKIYVGAPSIRCPLLRSYPLLPIKKLFSPDPKDLNGILNENVFYAESWALVHYMTFGSGMQGGALLSRFFSLIQSGESQDDAFRQVFGSFKQMDKALQSYVGHFAFSAAVYDSPPTIDEHEFTARTLPAAEADAELAAFHIWTHDPNDALLLAQKALKADPKLGVAHEDIGYALFSQGKDAQAKEQFGEAYSLNNALYLSLFAKTMLSPIAADASASDQALLKSALSQVIQLNPQFAPAFIEYARLDLRENHLDSALRVSRRAEELEPARAGYHLLTGRILLRMGRDAQAAKFAKFVADRWKGPDHDEAVELWNRIPTKDRPAGIVVDDSPLYHGLRTASGILTSITCTDNPKEYTIAIDDRGKTLTFHTLHGLVGGFSDTLWYGKDHFSFCYHLDGLRAVVRYRASSSTSYDGEVTELEVRDSFPVPVSNSDTSNPRTASVK
jgi:Tfp pilus assembly protein PilF